MKRDAKDAKWSRQVRSRDAYRCNRCGVLHASNSRGLHAAHIFGRGTLRTRHDLDNGIALCYGCHRVFDSMAKADRAAFARSILGDERYQALEQRARKPRKRLPAGTD